MKGLRINGYEIIATRRINGTADEWLAVFHRPNLMVASFEGILTTDTIGISAYRRGKEKQY
jgi:hypothetical protein